MPVSALQASKAAPGTQQVKKAQNPIRKNFPAPRGTRSTQKYGKSQQQDQLWLPNTERPEWLDGSMPGVPANKSPSAYSIPFLSAAQLLYHQAGIPIPVLDMLAAGGLMCPFLLNVCMIRKPMMFQLLLQRVWESLYGELMLYIAQNPGTPFNKSYSITGFLTMHLTAPKAGVTSVQCCTDMAPGHCR